MKINNEPLHISRIQAWAFRQPVDLPVVTSFGTMTDRPAVFVRIEDQQGCFGWGEIFANWPAAGAEHRVNLLIQDIADLVFNIPIFSPSDLFNVLSQKTHIRAMQCGEMGPFRQVIAGLDTALWDLYARQSNLPVRRLLNPDSQNQVPCYSSGINIRDTRQMINQARQQGLDAFKVKVGFDLGDDIRAVKALCAELSPNEQLFVDANQAWDLPKATKFIEQLDGAHLGWLEEAMPVDAADHDWSILASQSTMPLAGGENIAGKTSFSAALELNALSVYQPDIAKWGGFTGCFEVAQKVQAAGCRYCPHFLGGGIGLVASANLLAAVGGDGLLEVDINNNELRDGFEGLGIEHIPDSLMRYKTHYRVIKRSRGI
jgi:D-galactarolactone cycloisomerase